jgi:GH35 family endo-1,4-beta-xylanase
VTEYDRQGALLARQVLDVLLPEVDGGEVLVWGLTDNHDSWEVGERPCLYDESNAKKSLYDEVRNAFLGIS